MRDLFTGLQDRGEARVLRFARTHSRRDPGAYYERKRAEGKRHNAAMICLARRRCNVIYAMLRDGTYYQPPTTEPTAPAAKLET